MKNLNKNQYINLARKHSRLRHNLLLHTREFTFNDVNIGCRVLLKSWSVLQSILTENLSCLAVLLTLLFSKSQFCMPNCCLLDATLSKQSITIVSRMWCVTVVMPWIIAALRLIRLNQLDHNQVIFLLFMNQGYFGDLFDGWLIIIKWEFKYENCPDSTKTFYISHLWIFVRRHSIRYLHSPYIQHDK